MWHVKPLLSAKSVVCMGWRGGGGKELNWVSVKVVEWPPVQKKGNERALTRCWYCVGTSTKVIWFIKDVFYKPRVVICKKRHFFCGQTNARKIPWKRAWQPTPVPLSWEFHRQRSLAGYIQSMGSQSQTWLSDCHLETNDNLQIVDNTFNILTNLIQKCILSNSIWCLFLIWGAWWEPGHAEKDHGAWPGWGAHGQWRSARETGVCFTQPWAWGSGHLSDWRASVTETALL